MSLTDAAESGDPLELLLALRATVVAALEDSRTHPRDVAPLTRRLEEIAVKIQSLESASGGDEIGEAVNTPDADLDLASI